MKRINVLVVLYALIRERVWTIHQLAHWLDTVLQNSHDVPYWITELALARDASAADAVLASAISDKNIALNKELTENHLHVGMQIARYIDGSMTAKQLLAQLFDVIDSGNFWCDDFEPFSELFSTTSEEKVLNHREDLLAYSRNARACVSEISRIRSLNGDEDAYILLNV